MFTRLISILVIALMLTLAPSYVVVNACFDPLDTYSIEVVLNKPGIAYNLSILDVLAAQGYVTKIKPSFGAKIAYVYRSHVDSRVIVVVSLQPIPIVNDGDSWNTYYLAIRIEPEVEQPKPYRQHLLYYRAEVTTSINKTEDIVKVVRTLRSYGWDVSYKSGDYVTSIEAYLDREESGFRFFIVIGMEINTSTRKALLWINIALPADGTSYESKSDIKELVVNLGILDEVLNALKVFGIRNTLSIDEFEYSFLLGDKIYTPKVNPEFLKRVFTYELLWMRSLGVVNISDEDVEELSRAINPGYAGWNSRLVYIRERGWITYAELGGSKLIRGIGCEVYFDPNNIPVMPSLINVTTTKTETITKTMQHTITTTSIQYITTTVKVTETMGSTSPLEPLSIFLGIAIGVVSSIIILRISHKRLGH